jgi:membrane-associated phospholipid phosphatase
MGNTFFFTWEVTLMEWLQAHLSSAWISLMSFFSLFGEELPLILIVGFVYWSYDKKMGRSIGLSALMGLTWNTMIKNLVLRLRPYFDHKSIKILRVVDPSADIYDISAQGYSFPSIHSTNAVTVFGSLAVNLRKRWMTVIAIVIPLLTGFSRIVVGAHYPTDVLAGWMLGLLSVALVYMLQKRVKNTLALYGILLITAVPGFFYCTSADYFTAMGLLIGFMGGTLLDDRCVHFEDTRKPLLMVARMLGGLVVYLVLNTLLKMPFSNEFLSNGSTAALMVRCVRYAIVAFVDFGVYPMLFKFENKILRNDNEKAI